MYRTLHVEHRDSIARIRFDRPEANNTINRELMAELADVLAVCHAQSNVVVLEGSPEVFCFGADFGQIESDVSSGAASSNDPGALYDLWHRLATGPYVSIALVRGRVNAGGMGFVAASDIVLADESALFSLSEMLFGVFPSCVLPYLIRRVGFQKAHYLTLMTSPVDVERAFAWGLVDAYGEDANALLRGHLLRLRRLSRNAIQTYKEHANQLFGDLSQQRSLSIAGNEKVFSDPENLRGIARYVSEGVFPWEATA